MYAVADVDGTISQKEKEKLAEIVRKELVPSEKRVDAYGTDVAFYSEFQFDIEEDTIAEPDVALESFLDFVKEHPSAFTTQMKETCIKIVKELADAYRGTNRLEEILVNKLETRLKALITKA